MRNIWLDGIMGVVVGDALGNPVQFMPRAKVVSRGLVKGMEAGGAFNTPEGTWTDDSSMTLAALDSIVRNKAIDYDDIMNNLMGWLFEGKFTPFGYSFDIGGTCDRAINNYRRNKKYQSCGVTGEYANGNGALMRIMPACLYCYEKEKAGAMSWKEVVDTIITFGGLTHCHQRTHMCCIFYYLMVKSILDNRDEEEKLALMELLQRALDEGFEFFNHNWNFKEEVDYLKRFVSLAEFKDTDEDKIASSGYVIHTIEAAVWSLINTDSYKEALLKAVNLGDDADTVGAVAGGLAALYYGYDAIPAEWLEVIKRKEWIEDMCKVMA